DQHRRDAGAEFDDPAPAIDHDVAQQVREHDRPRARRGERQVGIADEERRELLQRVEIVELLVVAHLNASIMSVRSDRTARKFGPMKSSIVRWYGRKSTWVG